MLQAALSTPPPRAEQSDRDGTALHFHAALTQLQVFAVTELLRVDSSLAHSVVQRVSVFERIFDEGNRALIFATSRAAADPQDAPQVHSKDDVAVTLLEREAATRHATREPSRVRTRLTDEQTKAVDVELHAYASQPMEQRVMGTLAFLMLYRGAPVEALSPGRPTALQAAIAGNAYVAALHLVRAGADVRDRSDEGRSVFHLAVEHSDFPLLLDAIIAQAYTHGMEAPARPPPSTYPRSPATSSPLQSHDSGAWLSVLDSVMKAPATSLMHAAVAQTEAASASTTTDDVHMDESVRSAPAVVMSVEPGRSPVRSVRFAVDVAPPPQLQATLAAPMPVRYTGPVVPVAIPSRARSPSVSMAPARREFNSLRRALQTRNDIYEATQRR